LRWLPAKLADDRIMVNIAAFQLRGYRGGEQLIEMRVVVGDKEHQTPTFMDVLEYIEVNPYWSIPNSIVINELAPKLVENIHYLEARNMQIYEGWEDDDTLDADDIDWDDYTDPEAIFPHVIKQDPGPGNALGRIKFMFPNQYSIYLHDTPEVNLFWAADRSFSHGCVRVHKPMVVADFVLRNTEDWDMERVRETLEDTDNTRIDLGKGDRMQVIIYYQTAWADDKGRVFFRPDVYQRDELLVAKFLGKLPDAETRKAARD
jgi:murein L,D-transpeptidase YcbB/YkuD